MKEREKVDTIFSFPVELKRPKWLVSLSLFNCIGFGIAGGFQLFIGIPMGGVLACIALIWGGCYWWFAHVPYLRVTQHEIMIPPHLFFEWDSIQSLILDQETLEVHFANHERRRIRVYQGDKATIERLISRMKPLVKHSNQE